MKVEKYLCWYAAEKRSLLYLLLWCAAGRNLLKKDLGFGKVKTVGISFTTSIQNKSAKKYYIFGYLYTAAKQILIFNLRLLLLFLVQFIPKLSVAKTTLISGIPSKFGRPASTVLAQFPQFILPILVCRILRDGVWVIISIFLRF